MAEFMARFRIRYLAAGLAAVALVFPAICFAGPTGKVEITDAWLRPPPYGGTATLGFMTLRSNQDMRLVGVKTAAAKAVSFQLMTREGSVVRMDPVDSIALPGGTPLTLKMGPGQHFLMLKQIGTDLKVGAVVPMIAIVEQATNGAKQSIRFNAKVMPDRGHRPAVEQDGEH